MRKDLLNKVVFWGVVFIPLFTFATDWYIMMVDTTNWSGIYGTSIALDSVGIPHIAYCRYNGPGLMYASLNSEDSTWILESVFDSAGVKAPRIAGIYSSLAFDSKGYPHISYFGGGLGYAWKDSLGWHTTQPYPGAWIDGTSLVLDKYDYPHIGYSVDWTDTTALVFHTYQDESNWHTEVVDTIFTGSPRNVTMAVDRGNHIHISYGDLRPGYSGLPGRGIMYGVRNEAGEWELEKMIDTLDVVFTCFERNPCLALDSLDHPCIAYESWDTLVIKGKLKYATKLDGSWNVNIVDTLIAGLYLSLDPLCGPHIIYITEREPSWLSYAWESDGVWHTEKVCWVGGGSGGVHYPGLIIDDNGYAHISYNKMNSHLNTRYATGHPEVGIEIEPELPLCTSLNVYPSIGKQSVKIEFTLNRKVMANLSIYNIAGQKITELVNKERDCGTYTIHWDIKGVKSGIYFCRLRTEKEVFMTQKIIILR